MKSTQDAGFTGFRLVHSEGMAMVFSALRARRLQPRDSAVLLRLIDCTDYKTGRVHLSAGQMAEDLGFQRTHVSASISRLKRELLLAVKWDKATGNRYLLMNPYLTSASADIQRRQWAQFQAALAA